MTLTIPEVAGLQLVDYDSNGDVVLIVGTTNEDSDHEHRDLCCKIAIQVSSKVLSRTSDVFFAMFSLSFEEGIALAKRYVANLKVNQLTRLLTTHLKHDTTTHIPTR